MGSEPEIDYAALAEELLRDAAMNSEIPVKTHLHETAILERRAAAALDRAKALEEALREMANDGCGVKKPGQLACHESHADRSDWCWSCMAVVALQGGSSRGE